MFRSGWTLVTTIALVACAETPRQNVFDPVAAPTIEMSSPVLDGGSILIEWRYLSEGGALKEFRVTRTAGDLTEEVTSVTATATTASDWRTESVRDSSLIAGLRVTYRVTGILDGGRESASASGTILVEGPRFRAVDPAGAPIRVEWTDPPSGTTGFEVVRTPEEGSPETVFVTDDPTVRAFSDTSYTASVVYSYQLMTILGGSTRLRSVPVEAGRYVYVRSANPDPGLPQFQRSVLYQEWRGLGTGYATFAFAIGESVVKRQQYTATFSPALAANLVVIDPGFDYVSTSLSFHDVLRRHFDRGLSYYVTGISKSNEAVFVPHRNFFPSVPDTVLTWPSSGATRTGVGWIDDRIIFFGGTTLRVLDSTIGDSTFKVVEETTIDSEPIDIDYFDGSLWLAYPDRLLRSNPALSLSEIDTWSQVPLPAGLVITAFSRIADSINPAFGDLVILDGTNGMIYVMDADGQVLLSMPAMGGNLEAGDISAEPLALVQADGSGVLHFFSPQGPVP